MAVYRGFRRSLKKTGIADKEVKLGQLRQTFDFIARAAVMEKKEETCGMKFSDIIAASGRDTGARPRARTEFMLGTS